MTVSPRRGIMPSSAPLEIEKGADELARVPLEGVNPSFGSRDASPVEMEGFAIDVDREQDHCSQCESLGTAESMGFPGENRRPRLKGLMCSASVAIKLTVFVGLLVVIACMAMGVVFWLTSQDVLRKELGPRLLTVVTLRKQSLLSYISSERNNMDLIASRVIITNMLLRANNGTNLLEREITVGIEDLKTALATLDQYMDGAFFELDGKLLLATANFSNATGPNSPAPQDLNYDDGMFLTFMNEGRRPNEAMILLSTKVVNNTQHLGYLQCTIAATTFRRLVYEPAGLESTGEVLVVRPGAQPNTMEFLADPQLSHGRFVALVTPGLFRAMFLNQSGSMTMRDYRGVKVAAAYAPMEFADWGIEAKINYDEAFHPIHRIRVILITTLASVLLFGIGGSYFLARLFTRRIVELNKTAAALAAGDMDSRVTERRPWMKDELAELTRTFNLMADELRANRSTLEERVRERTRDLAAANARFALEIEERKKAEAEVVKAKDEAISANKIKSNFLANMSHEIRTPLNGIINCTELCLDTRTTPDQHEYLELVKFSAEHLLNVINDILDFSKIEAGKMDLEKIEFSLRNQLEHAVSVLAVRATAKHVELLVDVAPDVPDRLLGDPGRLFQIFVNLIGNAIKFTPRTDPDDEKRVIEPGQVVVTALVDSIADNGEVVLKMIVDDNGIGIARVKQKFLFKAFSQVDSSTTRLYGGTGLGLVISAKLAAAMGGQMWVDSEEHCGSQFSFSARFELDPNQDQQQNSIELESMEGISVLIVDDNAMSRRLLERMLTSWGVSAHSAAGACEAVTAVADSVKAGHPYKLLLVDLDMPGANGLDFLEMLRKDHRGFWEGVTVVMLTPVDYSDLPKLKDFNVQGNCTKPVKESALRRVLQGAINSNASPVQPGRTGPRKRATAQRKLHILVAEDNPVNQKVAQALLSKWGHTFKIAENGDVAVKWNREDAKKFDICLMDVQMPVMDGLSATEAIRKEEETSGRHLPIVAMTAHAMSGDADRCITTGMDGYMSKPLNAEKLHNLLNDFALSDSLEVLQRAHGPPPDRKPPRRASIS